MKTKIVKVQRERSIEYTVFASNQEGLEGLVKVVGASAVVNLYQEYYMARNSLLSRLDVEDKGEAKDAIRHPEKGSEVKIEFDLTENFPKPGERKSKWGDLKAFVDSAKATLEEAFKVTKKPEHDPKDDENVKRVAARLKIRAEEEKAELLGM